MYAKLLEFPECLLETNASRALILGSTVIVFPFKNDFNDGLIASKVSLFNSFLNF